jgi:transposase-like protein
MSKQEFSIPALMQRLTSESAAYELLEDLRWNGTPVCPHCGTVDKHYFLKPRGEGRATRTGSISERRVWKCRDCRKQFTVLVGTTFHGTKIPVRTWVLVILEMCASKNGVSAREIERKYDLTAKTAWFMLHRIREAMKLDPMAGLLRGTIQADETWIGGNPRNRHRSDPREQDRASSTTDKQPVFSLVHYETREVRSTVVPDVTGATLQSALAEQADLPSTHLHTDGSKAYTVAAPHVADHQFVSHESGEYVSRGGVSTNLAEGYFSQLKRSIDGTHHHVSREHLGRYLAQFDFMYSHCRENDSTRLRRVLENVAGRRLTYKPLVGGV